MTDERRTDSSPMAQEPVRTARRQRPGLSPKRPSTPPNSSGVWEVLESATGALHYGELDERYRLGCRPSRQSWVLNPTPPQWIRVVDHDGFATSLAASIRLADLRTVFRTEAHGP